MAGLAVRFLILQRDNFTCQYCGQTAPGVVLEVDHIVPRTKGGSNLPGNLITACWDCNRGKSARQLTPEQVARFSNRPLPTEPSRPVRRVSVQRRAEIVHEKRVSIAELLKTVPVAMDFVYVAPDEFIPQFTCAVCGFLNTYEGDGCGCKRRAERDAEKPEAEREWCRRCRDVEVDEEGEYCEECYSQVHCDECGGWVDEDEDVDECECERVPDEDEVELEPRFTGGVPIRREQP